MWFPKRTGAGFQVLGFNGPFLGICCYVQKGSKRVQEITLDVSTQHCSCGRASVSVSCQSSEALFCWSDAWSAASFPFHPSTFTFPELVRLLTRFKTLMLALKVAGEVSVPWRLNPWRLNRFWCWLSPLPPCSAAQSVYSTRVLVWWQNLFCDRSVGLDHRSERFQQFVADCACRLHQWAHDIRPWILWAFMAETGAGFVGCVEAFASLSWTAPATRQGTSEAIRKELTRRVDPDNIQVAEVDAFFIIPAVTGAAFGPDAVLVWSLSWQLCPLW